MLKSVCCTLVLACAGTVWAHAVVRSGGEKLFKNERFVFEHPATEFSVHYPKVDFGVAPDKNSLEQHFYFYLGDMFVNGYFVRPSKVSEKFPNLRKITCEEFVCEFYRCNLVKVSLMHYPYNFNKHRSNYQQEGPYPETTHLQIFSPDGAWFLLIIGPKWIAVEDPPGWKAKADHGGRTRDVARKLLSLVRYRGKPLVCPQRKG